MAVKKSIRVEERESVSVKKMPKLVTAGWVMLLLAGLGHMMPTQLGPVLNWGVFGVSLQMVIGVASVVIALYFLLEE